ncbi:MAG: GNAT family N-acetyltransferase [Lachnospiraceae bacterium]
MEFQYNNSQIALYGEDNELLADVTFPEIDPDTVDINHTFVDDSLRGQGIAGKLMKTLAEQLRTQNKKAVLTCSYAQAWFKKHPEYHDLIDL